MDPALHARPELLLQPHVPRVVFRCKRGVDECVDRLSTLLEIARR